MVLIGLASRSRWCTLRKGKPPSWGA